MSTFTPTDDSDGCFFQGGSCDIDERCFITNVGSSCRKYTPPAQYPVTGADVQNPPGWYLSANYPAVRYTGSLVNQTQGANCTTIPIPLNSSSSYDRLITFIRYFDLGKMVGELDAKYTNTLVQYRGNCNEGYYCSPLADLRGQPPKGELPGTCQPVKAEGEPCLATNMCSNWHIGADRVYNEQYRCQPPAVKPANWTVSGTCTSLNVGSGVVNFNESKELQSTARTYLLSTLLLFCMVFLFLWYRRQKARQRARQNFMLGDNGSLHDNMGLYQQRVGGVNRRPDENDNGELPAYGMHRRDERVTGPAAEEIGMYSFASGNPPPSASPNGVHPTSSAAARPVQQNYPFPMTHPAMMNTLLAPGTTPPPGALYSPPSSEPTPLTAQQAEAAAIAAAAAAALPTPRPTAASLQEGGLLPPAYEPSTTQSSAPSTTNTPVATAAELSLSGAPTVDTDGAIKASGDRTMDEKRARQVDSHRGELLPDTKEKPLAVEDEREEDGKDTDQVSTSSGSAASGSGSHSAVHSISGSSSKKQE
ncbi:hypothetical protein EC968_008361 [Mortierella alpina]|nr:hypothetical protein EC968_008361 [Mortierella alpina]